MNEKAPLKFKILEWDRGELQIAYQKYDSDQLAIYRCNEKTFQSVNRCTELAHAKRDRRAESGTQVM